MVRGRRNPRYLGLPARLRKARNGSDLTRMGLAEKAGVGAPTVLYTETNKRIPTVATVSRLATALDVCAGWLGFGIGDAHAASDSTNTDDMGTRLHTARDNGGLTKAALARIVDLSPSAFAKIENGGQTGIDTIEKLAIALRVSPAWLAFGVGPQTLPTRRKARTAQPDARG